MANHKSAEKRARQTIKKTIRNRKIKAGIKSAIKKALATTDLKAIPQLQSEAFSQLQKGRRVLHRNTIKRKMARVARALSKKATATK